MVRGHGRRNEDFPGEEVLGLKRGRGSYTVKGSGKIQKREWEGKREENTEILVNKISRMS